ncbi:hypothetical protein BJ912DRAFT_926344 [Pholiota molesta]|nr:hypothetical protein BJ912DRAFT_926344 [Pholiota molesta]
MAVVSTSNLVMIQASFETDPEFEGSLYAILGSTIAWCCVITLAVIHGADVPGNIFSFSGSGCFSHNIPGHRWSRSFNGEIFSAARIMFGGVGFYIRASDAP